jgi:hypothetical protein
VRLIQIEAHPPTVAQHRQWQQRQTTMARGSSHRHHRWRARFVQADADGELVPATRLAR